MSNQETWDKETSDWKPEKVHGLPAHWYVAYLSGRIPVLIILAALTAGLLFAAWLVDETHALGGWGRSVLIEAGAATGLFLALHSLSERDVGVWLDRLLVALGGAIVLVAALLEPYWQAVGVELGAGMVLLAALDRYTSGRIEKMRDLEAEVFHLNELVNSGKLEKRTLELMHQYDIHPVGAAQLASMDLQGYSITAEDVEEFRIHKYPTD
jgi:hypothetical protein